MLSIRWDENIETMKAKRKGAKERRGGTTVATRAKKDGSQRSSQKSQEGRQRGSLSTLFPEMMEAPSVPEKDPKDVRSVERGASATETQLPALSSLSPTSTPPRKVRPRPQSEQLLGRTDRPQGVVPSEDGDGESFHFR